ncbi:MAG TPA: DNA gyrase modulator, partial [Candidatus Aquilonibacter sp.]
MQYADIRFEIVRSERIEVRNGVVASLADAGSTGYGIRALVDGAWGFAASSDLTDGGIDRCAARAVAIARASASIARNRFGATPQNAYVDRFATPVVRDPQDVPLGDRVA